MLCRCTALVLSVGILAASAAAADWPQWRGPHRDGVVAGVKFPEKWPNQLKADYTLTLGEGHASPVYADGRLVVFYRDGDKEIIRGYDPRFGKREWEVSYRAPYEPAAEAKAHGAGPKSTPAIAGGKVYTQGITSHMHCIDLKSGKVEWEKDLRRAYRADGPQYGCAVSPLVDGDQVITLAGGQKEGFLLALDAKTGKEKWKTSIDGPAYGSPIIGELAGVRQVLTFTRAAFISVDPADGKVLWQKEFTTAYEQNIVTPVVWKDLVIISGYSKPTMALKPKRDGEKWTVSLQWQNDKLRMYMSSPVIVDDHLYGFDDSGQMVCIKLENGRTAWNKGNFGKHANVLAAGKRIMVFYVRGEMTILEADPKQYQEVAKLKLSDSEVWAHPAFGDGMFFIKAENKLIGYPIPE